MTFLIPLGLLALLTIPLIVLLHLIRERRRRVAVPSLQHWLSVPRRNAGQRIRRLPITPLLLLHLLIATLLGLAIGRPQLANLLSGRAGQLAIVIDTSTSMAAREGTTTRRGLAQERARALLGALGPGDRAALIVAGPSARLIGAGGPDARAALETVLDELRPGGTGTDLADALALAETALDQRRPGQIVVLTDGSASPVARSAVAFPIEWQVLGNDQPNRAITAFAARPLGNTVQVYARISNLADAPFSADLRLYGDDQLIDTRRLTIDSRSESEQTWRLSAGPQRLRLALDGADPLAEDDQALLSVAPVRPINALLVSDNPDPLRRALAAVPGVHVAVIAPGNYTTAAAREQADLTVFERFVPDAWPAGAALAIDPPPGSSLLAVADQPRLVSAQRLDVRSATLAGLSLGGVNFGPVQPITPPDWATIELSSEGLPLILRGRTDDHELAIWAFGLGESNLPTRLAFPILVARTVRDLAPAPLPAALSAGAPLHLRPDPRVTTVELIAPDGRNEHATAAATLTFDSLTRPGWYRVVEHGPGGTLFEGRVAVNAGAVQEADLRQQPQAALSASLGGTPDAPVRSVVDLWPLLALAALAVLILEWGYTHR